MTVDELERLERIEQMQRESIQPEGMVVWLCEKVRQLLAGRRTDFDAGAAYAEKFHVENGKVRKATFEDYLAEKRGRDRSSSPGQRPAANRVSDES